MKYIYSWNSFYGQRLPTPFELQMAKTSVGTLHDATGEEITLYADIDAVNFFVENRVPFDKIFSVKYQFDKPKFWNTGKLEIYARQTEPFLHVDFDTVFFPGFRPPEADIITEQKRIYDATDEIKTFGINTNVPEKLICSGLLGGSYNLAFYELLQNLIDKQKLLKEEKPPFDLLVSLEEYALTQIAEKYKLTVAELDVRYFAHFQGENKEQRFRSIYDEMFNQYY